ncbi:LPS export ABC transporter ATP-binding protein [candidate division CSSED10-310 bacterium]|uniref:LPS export ABC transporter ATP-binding protein n=1 Tax=candidate division CSSED10-310 bacterium TaxID=2855610 RepID=A0ABV6Z365_UNCC1
MTITLSVQQLTKAYSGRTVVDGIDLRMQSGEVVGLLGPNGAGKTTTFYMVIGLVRADKGKVFLEKEDITQLPMYIRARKGIGYLTQEPSIFRKLSVEENVMAILETLDLTKAQREEKLHKLLDEFGVEHLAKSKAYTLSGGERRRVEIARSLASSPSFILLDEPFAGIDPLAVLDIQNIISQLRNRDIGILITDHNVRETLEITDRAYIINEGTILKSGTPLEISRDEQVKRFYLGERFKLEM